MKRPNEDYTTNCYQQFAADKVEALWKYYRKGKNKSAIDEVIVIKLREFLRGNEFHYAIFSKHVCRVSIAAIFKISNFKLQT